MKRTILLLLFVFIGTTIYCQNGSRASSSKNKVQSNIVYREFGYNTVAILHSVPILPSINDSSFPTHTFFFKKKRTNRNALFRFHVGGSLGGIDLNVTSFELKIGMEYPKKIVDKWEYYYGYDFLTFVTDSAQAAGLGVGPIFGLKYLINDFITLGTEGSGYLTLTGGDIAGVAINMRPVNGIFFSFKLYK